MEELTSLFPNNTQYAGNRWERSGGRGYLWQQGMLSVQNLAIWNRDVLVLRKSGDENTIAKSFIKVQANASELITLARPSEWSSAYQVWIYCQQRCGCLGSEKTKPWKANLMSQRYALNSLFPNSWLDDLR